MRVPASQTAESGADHPANGALAPAIGILNGCVIGLGCWAALLWLAFG